MLEAIQVKSFSRFFGCFESIFDSNPGDNIDKKYITPGFESKIDSKQPKNRLKLLTWIACWIDQKN
jgi:hypothetical protein